MTPVPLLTVTVPEPRRERVSLNDLIEDTKGAPNDLKHSMRTVGQLTPILLQVIGGEYRIRAGHRRTATARALNWLDIDAEIHDGLNDTQWALILAGEHNRRPNPVDEARTFQHLLGHLTEQGISANTGIPLQTIRARLTLLNLPPDLLALIGPHFALGVAEDAAKLRGPHATAAVTAIRAAHQAGRPFTARDLKAITTARSAALGQALLAHAPAPALPLIPPAHTLATEVRNLAQRRGVTIDELIEELRHAAPQPATTPLHAVRSA